MLDDTEIRPAAFRFLEEQQRLAGDEGVLSRKVLADGFVYEGQRVPLMGPQGIFKRVLRDIPLSITTVAVVEGKTRPHDDAFGEDGLLRYRYRGTDPRHHEGEVPLLVIDGRPFTWDQVGRMLMSFEGFTIRAVVDDTIEVVGEPLLDEGEEQPTKDHE